MCFRVWRTSKQTVLKARKKSHKNKLVAKSDVSLLCHARQWHLFASPFRQTHTQRIFFFFQRSWKNIHNTCACIRIYITLEYTSTNTDPNSCSKAKTAQNSHFNTATHKFSANCAMAAQQDCRDCLAGTVLQVSPAVSCTGQGQWQFPRDVHRAGTEAVAERLGEMPTFPVQKRQWHLTAIPAGWKMQQCAGSQVSGINMSECVPLEG